MKMRMRKRSAITMIIGLIGAASVGWVVLRNPLPSDSEMIGHLRKEEPTYTELATTLLAAESNGNHAVKAWLEDPGMQEKKRRIRAKDECCGTESDQWWSGVRANVPLNGDTSRPEVSVDFYIE